MARIHLATYGSFSTERGLKTPLVFLFMLSDGTGSANIIYYEPIVCKSVKRSVMTAEVQALILGFYRAYTIQEKLSDHIGGKLNIAPYVD